MDAEPRLGMASLVNYVAFGFAASLFLAFAWAVRFHFTTIGLPRTMAALSVLTVAAFGFFAWRFWTSLPRPVPCLIGILIDAASALLFFFTVRATRVNRLRIAFDPTPPEFLLESGPYAVLRHPFYVAYILFWIGCGIEALSLTYWLIAAILLVFYWSAADREERAMESSALAGRYRAYRSRTGMFVPKLVRPGSADHGEGQ